MLEALTRGRRRVAAAAATARSRSGAAGEGGDYPSRPYAWYVVGVLLVVMALGYLDRTVLSLVITPVQAEFGLSDSAMGLLLGPAFVVLFVAAGLPVGYLVDRYKRRDVLFCGVGLWTLATGACGLAHGFWGLFIARMLVSLGEAAMVPAVFTIVADYFPPNYRGRSLAVVSLGVALGSGLAMLGGGALLAHAHWLQALPWAFLAGAPPWRLVFIACAACGGAVVLLLLTVAEPVRRGSQACDGAPAKLAPFLRANGVTAALIACGYSLFHLMILGVSLWTPTLLLRRHGIAPSRAGLLMGLLLMTLLPLAGLLAGTASDRTARIAPDGRLRVAIFTTSTFLPGIALLAFAPGASWAIVGYAPFVTSGYMLANSIYVIVQDVTPHALRGRMLALYTMIANLTGIGLGPALIAFVTDGVFHDRAKLNLSIMLVATPGFALAVVSLSGALGGYRALRLAAGHIADL